MTPDKTLEPVWRALGLLRDYIHSAGGDPDHEADLEAAHEALIATADRVVEQRELLAAWMFTNSYATGHGDTVESLLVELDWQHAKKIAAISSAIRILSDTNRSDTARILDARDRLVIGRGAA